MKKKINWPMHKALNVTIDSIAEMKRAKKKSELQQYQYMRKSIKRQSVELVDATDSFTNKSNTEFDSLVK